MKIIIFIYVFLMGASLGSFALVVADRWNTKRSWARGRSMCDSCKRKLTLVDLIPIVSWTVFRGRCRRCHKPVSSRYPLAEVISAVTLLSVFIYGPFEVVSNSGQILWEGIAVSLVWLIIHTLCMVLIFIDLRSMIMPYKFLFPLLGVALLYRIAVHVILDVPFNLSSLFIAAVLGGGIFGLLWYVSKGRWIGDSDIILGIVIALILGGPIELWVAYFVSSISGLMYGLAISVKKKKQLHSMKIPYGPFLILGMFVSLLVSQTIVDRYIGIFFY